MIENEDSITSRLVNEAGILQGMRVLDVGCGKGDISLLVEKIVGAQGEVVGIDRSQSALEIARGRVNMPNIRFLDVDLSKELPDIGMFDAIVGRRVLMYLTEPAEVLSRLLKHLKVGGIVAFQEIDSTVSRVQTSPHPLHEKANRWIWETIKKEGANLNMGFALPSLLKEVGCNVISVKAEANIQGQESHAPMVNVVGAILPRIIEHDVASEEEINIGTLEDRLGGELLDGSVFISDMSFSVFGEKV